MITNESRKIILANNHNLCSSVFSKAKGLMFSFPINDFAIVFPFKKEKKLSLHMFFVFFAIDVLFLNKKGIVVDLKEKFLPFALYTSKKASTVIELPCNTINATHTKIGDYVMITGSSQRTKNDSSKNASDKC